MKNELRDDNILILSSGKKLGYAEYGNREGIPILMHHGNPGSRLFWGMLNNSPFNEKYRLIAPDRPGYGLSDHYGKESLKKWPGIIKELMSYLEIDKFYNCGVSGGGPYALICARDLCERINGTALISPVGPLVPESVGNMNVNKKLFSIAPRFPALIKLQFKITTKMLRKNPERFISLFEKKVKGSDRAIISTEKVRNLLKIDFLEAYRQNDSGSVYDCFIPSQWPIELDSLKGNIQIWYGENDRSIGNMAGYMGAKIRGSETYVIKGKGHFLVFEQTGKILDKLVNGKE